MKSSSEDIMAEVIVDTLPSAQPLNVDHSAVGWSPIMPFFAGMLITALVFIMVTIYCGGKRQRYRKHYLSYDRNKNISKLMVPWYPFQGKLGDLRASIPGERRYLLSHVSLNTIKTHSSKNKADSKYQKIKRQFPYFVTIPEEEEQQEDSQTF